MAPKGTPWFAFMLWGFLKTHRATAWDLPVAGQALTVTTSWPVKVFVVFLSFSCPLLPGANPFSMVLEATTCCSEFRMVTGHVFCNWGSEVLSGLRWWKDALVLEF